MPATDVDRVLAFAESFGAASPNAETTAALELIVDAVSTQIEDFLGFPLLIAERVEVPLLVRRHQRLLQLAHQPVTAIELRQATSGVFADDATIIDPAHYFLHPATGVVVFRVPLIGGAGTLQATSTGGIGANLAAVEAAEPRIVQAATMAAAEMLRRRKTLTQGTASSGVRGTGGVSYLTIEDMPPASLALLRPLRRRRFCT